jgi:hypothetical protein
MNVPLRDIVEAIAIDVDLIGRYRQGFRALAKVADRAIDFRIAV